jgi:molecular chaperone DnaK
MFDDLLEDDALDELESGGTAVGIDLGTTNSVVAAMVDGQCQVLTSIGGHDLHPSAVAWLPNGELLTGVEARDRRVIDPTNTILSAKRIIGQPFSSENLQEAIAQLPYEVVEGANQEPLVVTRKGKVSIPAVSSHVLAHVKRVAERALGTAVTHCVVTVPANFSDGQRAATRQAAELSGMEVLRIINEPTAAALAHGQSRESHQRIAVYDLGGGTFDLSLLAVRGSVYEVIGTGGDPFLGGDDIDNALTEKLTEMFLAQHRFDPRGNVTAMARLKEVSEQIKMQLSSEEIAEGTISQVATGVGGKDLPLDFSFTRTAFEEMIRPVVMRSLEQAQQVLSQANVTPQHVDEVILVGGSTRIPYVQNCVAQLFGQRPKMGLNPMHAVAMGAAIQAQNLFSPSGEAGLLMDITPHSFGIATAGGYADAVVAKNSRLPAEATKVFGTSRDNQEEVRIRVCQGESRTFSENIPVGELVLSALPQHRRGELKIQVTFLVDADGILQVSAKNLSTGASTSATLSAVGHSGER